jgi:hypothetical protein
VGNNVAADVTVLMLPETGTFSDFYMNAVVIVRGEEM